MNFELYQDYQHADIVKIIKHDKMEWAGQVARMSDERAAKTIFISEPGRDDDFVVGHVHGGYVLSRKM